MSNEHEAAKKLAQAIDVMADRIHEAFKLEAERMRPAFDAMTEVIRKRDAQIAEAGIEIMAKWTRDEDKVARLRSRIVGLYRALRENQQAAAMDLTAADLTQQVAASMLEQLRAELGNALRMGAQYRESAAALDADNERLESAIRWALGQDGKFLDRPFWKGSHWWRSELRRRARMDDSLRPAAESVAEPVAEPVAEKASDLGAQVVRVLEANGVDPHCATAREIQAAMDAVGLIGQEAVGPNPAGPSGGRP